MPETVLSLLQPVSSRLPPLPADFGTPIALLGGEEHFPGEQNSQGVSVHAAAVPGQKTGRKKECNHETSIRSRLVSHFARASSVDDIPVHSVRDLAGELARFYYFGAQWRQWIGFVKAALYDN